jgi:CheY-like chemotaxis protein
MSAQPAPITILMADDDEEDQMLASEALEEAQLGNDLRFVNDGEELLAYLRRQGRYADAASSPRPGLILLDLNMPRMDGREALQEIKADPSLRSIPVVILTTSRAQEDIVKTYDLGAAGFVVKPVVFDGLVDAVRAIGKYWIQVVARPDAVD